jgi:REP element-mobilizing transposase RayT
MQNSLFKSKPVLKFGGSLLKGKRKSVRPICTKRSIHLVLKASEHRLLKNEATIRSVVDPAAKKWGIRIYRFAVASDHVHLLIRVPTRTAYKYFIQRISGAIALKLKIKWELRPFTRVVAWGLGFRRAANYVQMNVLEAIGFIDYQPRGRGALKRRPWFSGATT